MGKIQNRTGRTFENEWVEYLSKKGYWVYNLPTGLGQPCDVIAVKKNITNFYECKTSKTDKFDTKRLEANQITASNFIKSCGNDNYFVVIKFKSGICMFSIDDIKNKKEVIFNELHCVK